MAIFIFTIVISSVYGAYRSSFRIINSTESLAEFSNMARISLERMSGDLESLYSGNDGMLLGKKKEVAIGRADDLTFTSTAHLVFSRKEQPAGYAIINYTTELDGDSGLLRLYRQDKAFRPGEPQVVDDEKGFLLCDSLAEVTFTYLDADGNESDDWRYEGGASAGKLPALIRISLRFADSSETKEKVVFSTSVAIP